jgi:hypothetical protein
MCLLVALAGTALAAMFPPHLTRLGASPSGAASNRQPHYEVPPDPVPLDYGTIDLPPLHGGRSTLIPFAGRQLPLPAGEWVEVALLRAGGPLAVQAMALARLRSGRLTGIVVATGTPAVEPAALLAQPARQCVDETDPVMQGVAPAPHPDHAAQDCWSVTRLVTARLRDAESRNPILKRSLDRLDTLGVLLPARFAASYYVRATQRGGLSVRILLAAGTDEVAMQRRTESWTRRWALLLRRGFDDALDAAEVTSALARDPAATDPS